MQVFKSKLWQVYLTKCTDEFMYELVRANAWCKGYKWGLWDRVLLGTTTLGGKHNNLRTILYTALCAIYVVQVEVAKECPDGRNNQHSSF